MPGYVPTVRQRRLAAELRRLREQSGRTGDQIAEALGWSASKISRYELSRTGIKPADVQKLLDYYGVSASRQEELLALASEATRRGWWEAYSDILDARYTDLIGLEDEARSCSIWQIECITGLLQTRDYARQINNGYREMIGASPAVLDRVIDVRMQRQRILTRDRPLELSVVLDESALLRQVADVPVMRAQLERLAHVAQMPNVSIRVLPLRGRRRPIMTASFLLLTFGEVYDAALDDVVATEGLTTTLYFHGETDTWRYRQTFQDIVESSLSADDSVELIASTATRVWRS